MRYMLLAAAALALFLAPSAHANQLLQCNPTAPQTIDQDGFDFAFSCSDQVNGPHAGDYSLMINLQFITPPPGAPANGKVPIFGGTLLNYGSPSCCNPQKIEVSIESANRRK